MARGRPPLGLGHVDGMDGARDAKRRLRVILQTLTGELTIEQASKALSISESRFHQLRKSALEGAMAGLEARPPGRPVSPVVDQTARVIALEADLREARIDLQAARVQTEVALVAPHLLRDRKKKTVRRKKRRRKG